MSISSFVSGSSYSLSVLTRFNSLSCDRMIWYGLRWTSSVSGVSNFRCCIHASGLMQASSGTFKTVYTNSVLAVYAIHLVVSCRIIADIGPWILVSLNSREFLETGGVMQPESHYTEPRLRGPGTHTMHHASGGRASGSSQIPPSLVRTGYNLRCTSVECKMY